MSHRIAEGWLHRPLPRAQPRARLFCFHHAGGAASAYRSWAAELPETLEVLPVQLPGRAERLSEPALNDVPSIVAAVVDALCPWLDRPYALFGHSMGAVIAAEAARRLSELDLRQPAHLVVSARRPPHLRSPDAPLQHLSDAEFVLEIQRRYGGIPPEVMQHADLMALLLPGLRADIAALENFQPPARAPLACPITVLGGQSDALTPPAHLEAWRRETRDDCHVQLLPGDHFYLTPQRDAVLALLRQRLAPLWRTQPELEAPV